MPTGQASTSPAWPDVPVNAAAGVRSCQGILDMPSWVHVNPSEICHGAFPGGGKGVSQQFLTVDHLKLEPFCQELLTDPNGAKTRAVWDNLLLRSGGYGSAGGLSTPFGLSR
jgi:hypothetical protein